MAAASISCLLSLRSNTFTAPTNRIVLPKCRLSSSSSAHRPPSPPPYPTLPFKLLRQTLLPDLPSSTSPAAFPPNPPPPPRPISSSFLSAHTPLACSLLAFFWCRAAAAATAAEGSIGASAIGLRIAAALRGTGWPDAAIVFALAALPVLELRGAIPVGYWMRLDPLLVTALSVAGNMVPVPFILLYLKKLASFLSESKNGSSPLAMLLDRLLQRAREKAGPVKEFQWLGLMLFVAVPFPGTGAWTGAIVASVLDMPFWTAITANFVGVVLAGLLVNLLVNLGLKYAVAIGVLLFFLSTFMWSILRRLKTHPIS